MIRAQGGDPSAPLPSAAAHEVLAAVSSGVVTELDAYAVGMAAWRLGAGRARKEDPVQAGAGIELHKKVGDRVTAGERLATLYTDEPARFPGALPELESGYRISDSGAGPVQRVLVLDRVSA